MKKLIIPAVVILAALALWQRDAIRDAVQPKTEAEKVEQELKKEGVLQEDGTYQADPEFDAEVNAIEEELGGAETGASGELDGLETQE